MLRPAGLRLRRVPSVANVSARWNLRNGWLSVSATVSCFLDAAFGEDSWEAFIHLTKLSIDPTAARLVSEYGLAEFMRHDKGLLFEGRGFDLLKEIKNWMTYFGISGLGLGSLATVCAGVRF